MTEHNHDSQLEIMAISYIYDKDMQLDSYRRFKNVINQLNEKNTL